MQVSGENHTKSVTKSQSTYKTDARSLFHVTKKERDELAEALLADSGPAWQLLKMLGPLPCHYALHWNTLFLNKADADKRLILDPGTIDKWRRAIEKHIKGPYYFCLEVGRKGPSKGLIHAHVVAGCSAGLPRYARSYTAKVAKYIKNTDDDKKRLFSYLFKPSVGITEDCDDLDAPFLPDARLRVNIFREAVKELGEGNLPELRGFVL